ncbi:unnamed protein product [Schistocephalus solidus]|uniref:ABC transmembrane type-1 domain-containing protein n=1 Tax=Schistocephalus solidus TaxID=70667 RepID=A0A183T1A9_SCHSO|nr:unnamed protein product [Schistocephalus solidus]
MLAVTEGLKLFQSLTGLTWTSSIVLSTLLLRTAVAFPLYTYTEKNQALVSRSFLSTIAIHAKQPGDISRSVLHQSFRVDFMKRCQAEGCHPLKSAAFGLIQLPLWITVTSGLRNACGLWVSPVICKFTPFYYVLQGISP